MRKGALWVLSIILVSSCAFAAEKVGPDAEREAHRNQMKAIKQAQREGKVKEQPGQKAEGKMAGFWRREGERSGLGDSGSNMNSFFKNMNPVSFLKNQEDAYNSRKGATTAK